MDQECKSKAQQRGLHTVDASEFLRRLGCIKPNSERADDTLAAIQKEPGLYNIIFIFLLYRMLPFQIILKQLVIFWSGEMFEDLTTAHDNFVLDVANGPPKWGPIHPNTHILWIWSQSCCPITAPQNSRNSLLFLQCQGTFFFEFSNESRIVMD